VSEEPSKDSPGVAASGDDINPASLGPQPETAQAEEPPPRKPRRRWLRRTSLRVRVIAAVAAAGVIAAIVFAAMPSNPPSKPAYASLPAPCGTVSLDALARYLPSPTATPVSVLPVPIVAAKLGSCKWSSTTGGEDRTLWLDLYISGGPSAIYYAKQSYDASLSGTDCHCKGVTVSTRRVTGLGDQATGILVNAGLDSVSSVGTGADLLVWSSNSEMILSYSATAAGSPQPPDAAELTWLISVAHDILADLARPVAVVAAPVVPEPHYAGSLDPCRMISATTLAGYWPGATADPVTASGNPPNPPGTRTSACAWDSGDGTILLSLTVYPDALSAAQGFSAAAQASSRSDSSTTVTGVRWLEDLGEQAVAVLETTPCCGQSVDVLVWSGNIELDYMFNVTNVPASASMLLAVGTAMARDGLAALATPSASSYLQEPVYASPHDTCALIRAATLARYAPGAAVDSTPLPSDGAGPQLNSCDWNSSNGILDLFVTIYANAYSALSGYEHDVQNADLNESGITRNGTQPVKGVGDQATAVFVTSLGTPEVELYVLSGNAEIEMTFDDQPTGPTLSPTGELAADIAMVRDVLSDLRRT
jgi:hypothetical protein